MTGHAHPLDKFKLIRFTFVLILLAYGKSGFTETMVIDDMKIFNGQVEKEEFCENTSTKWCFVSDKVMGGVSEGSLELIKNDAITYYKMKGNVSTKNNGGFLQFRTELNDHPLGKLYKGVRIKVRGNNEEYAIHLRTKYLFLPWQYYESKFKVSGNWQTIELPLKDFRKSNFYQPSSVSSIDIKTLGVVAIGRDFQADIDLSYIELY